MYLARGSALSVRNRENRLSNDLGADGSFERDPLEVPRLFNQLGFSMAPAVRERGLIPFSSASAKDSLWAFFFR